MSNKRNKFYRKGVEHLENGDYKEAIDAFNGSLNIHPDFPEGILQRGTAYLLLNDDDRALKDYEQAEELKPEWGLANYYLAVTYRKLEMYPTALAYIDRAIFLDPNDSDFYCERGFIYEESEQEEEALASFSRAIELNGEHVPAYISRGEIYQSREKWKEALGDYSRAIDIDPKDDTVYANRGYTYYDMGDYSKAIEDFSAAIAIDPEYSPYYFARANDYSNLR
ncbi:tetratricopeptide repeat protein [Numidum massiliense]|uniref:tetratricopeptide repeat protein n=1 Tax=Numidum massiliense TaxID=1522315 RepID=UPI00164DD5C9|nr:tetratricopeptide repeat protein [Numidum massiliense]